MIQVLVSMVTYHPNLLVGFGREGQRTAVGHFVSLSKSFQVTLFSCHLLTINVFSKMFPV